MRAFFGFLVLFGIAPGVLTQSTANNQVISVFLVDTDPQPLVASVINANPTITSMYISCPSGTDSNNCGYNPGITVVNQNSNTWQASITDGSDFSLSWSCVLGTSTAVCVESAGGAQANFPGQSTTTYSGTELARFPVTVTAGAERLAAAAASTTTGPSGARRTTSSMGVIPRNSTISATGQASRTVASNTFGTVSMSLVPSAAADQTRRTNGVGVAFGILGLIAQLL